MDEEVATLIKQVFDEHCKLADKVTVLQARASIDHWIVKRLLSTSNLLGELDDGAREALQGVLETARILTSISKGKEDLDDYIASIRARVEELSGRPFAAVGGIKPARRTRY